MPAPATHRSLFTGAGLHVAEFHLWPGHPAWDRVNEIGPEPLVVFPGTSVTIAHVGREPVVANPNHVMFYSGGQAYRRELRHERGDHCVFVGLGAELAAELAAAVDATGVERGRFPWVAGPCDAAAQLARHLLLRDLRAGVADPLAVGETAHELVRRAAFAAAGVHARPRRRPRTERAHAALSEDAKALLERRLAERVTLEQLGRALHASPFQLARVFRARTGFSLHAYRHHLRLRAALDALAEPGVDLAGLACDVGFASHSHLTDAFRAAFGMPPSVLRDGAAQRLPELRRILEAPLPAPA